MNPYIRDVILPRGRGYDPFLRNSLAIGCEPKAGSDVELDEAIDANEEEARIDYAEERD